VYARLDSRSLLRGDTAARVALHQFLFNTGALTPNEIRDLEDMSLLECESADKTYMQQGFAPLSMVAAAVAGGGDNAQQMSVVLQVLDKLAAGQIDRTGAIALIVAGSASIGLSDEAATAIVDGALAQLPEPPVEPVGEVFDLQSLVAEADDDSSAMDSSVNVDQQDDSSAVGDAALAAEEDALNGT
jgi:hypothetical protein